VRVHDINYCACVYSCVRLRVCMSVSVSTVVSGKGAQRFGECWCVWICVCVRDCVRMHSHLRVNFRCFYFRYHRLLSCRCPRILQNVRCDAKNAKCASASQCVEDLPHTDHTEECEGADMQADDDDRNRHITTMHIWCGNDVCAA